MMTGRAYKRPHVDRNSTAQPTLLYVYLMYLLEHGHPHVTDLLWCVPSRLQSLTELIQALAASNDV